MTNSDFETLTHRIIGCAFEVGNQLGIGYVEKVYENAMVHEMRKRGLKVAQQVRLEVFYDGISVGEFFADVVVEGCVLLELKSAKTLLDAHTAQALNYLKTTGLTLALVINFGTPRVQTQRVVRNFQPSS